MFSSTRVRRTGSHYLHNENITDPLYMYMVHARRNGWAGWAIPDLGNLPPLFELFILQSSFESSYSMATSKFSVILDVPHQPTDFKIPANGDRETASQLPDNLTANGYTTPSHQHKSIQRFETDFLNFQESLFVQRVQQLKAASTIE